jgi:aspartate-semialdehyde dehydrogenase
MTEQAKAWVDERPISHSVFSRRILFNVIPQIDVFQENGYTKKEMKMVHESKKILDSSIKVCPAAVRVRELLSAAPGVIVMG